MEAKGYVAGKSEVGYVYYPAEGVKTSEEIFKNVMTELCDEEDQKTIRQFLSYLQGTDQISPFDSSKIMIAFVLEFQAEIFMAWGCDHHVRSPFFTSAEQLKSMINKTLALWEADGVTRDMPGGH